MRVDLQEQFLQYSFLGLLTMHVPRVGHCILLF